MGDEDLGVLTLNKDWMLEVYKSHGKSGFPGIIPKLIHYETIQIPWGIRVRSTDPK